MSKPRKKQDRSDSSPHWQKKADKINRDRLEKAQHAVPLFADQVANELPITSAKFELQRWRKNISEGVERGARICGPGVHEWESVLYRAYLRIAAGWWTGDDAQAFDAFAQRTYPSWSMRMSVLVNLLAGDQPIEVGWRKEPAQNTLGFKLVPERIIPAAGYVPRMGKLELFGLFEVLGDGQKESPDDGGLAARIDAILKGLGNATV